MKIRLISALANPKEVAVSCVIDQELLVDALNALLRDKRQAYDLVKDTASFRPEDFAIPQLAEVLCIVEEW